MNVDWIWMWPEYECDLNMNVNRIWRFILKKKMEGEQKKDELELVKMATEKNTEQLNKSVNTGE